MKNSIADTDSEAKQSKTDSKAKKGQVTELEITGYNSEAVKILFDYIAGKIFILSYLQTTSMSIVHFYNTWKPIMILFQDMET